MRKESWKSNEEIFHESIHLPNSQVVNSPLTTDLFRKDGVDKDKETSQYVLDGQTNGDVCMGHPPEAAEVDFSVSETQVTVQVYSTRYWILTTFSLVACLQTVVWGTFGPIMDSAEEAFGWENSIIAVLQSLGPLSIICFIAPTTWFTQKYGLRKGIVTAISCITFGTAIRCVTRSDTAFTALAIIGGFINGIAGCFVLSLPAMVAATWFPPKERTTATAIGSLTAQLGGVVMYLSPLIVRTSDGGESAEEIKGDIMTLMYIEFGISFTLFLSILIYFPDKPTNPPSLSSNVVRDGYLPSIRMLIRNDQFQLVLLCFGFSYGIPVVWISVMNFSLDCIGIGQKEAMWVAIVAISFSAVTAFITARITDSLYGHLKISIIGLLGLSSLFFFWFLLLTTEAIPVSKGQVNAAVAGGISLEYASVPLLIELAVELAYPCSEGVVGASMTAFFNVVAAVFLLLFIIQSTCYYWVNYVLVGCTLLTIVPILFVKETHLRSDLDRN